MGLVDAVAEHYPEADWQWCAVHFYRDTWSEVPPAKVKTVAAMLKAIHAREDIEVARKKAADVVAKLKEMKLPKAARQVEETIGETLTYMNYPREHWRNLKTKNPLERHDARDSPADGRVSCGAFPDGQMTMLAAARLRHMASTHWGQRRYMDMERLRQHELEGKTRRRCPRA